MDECDLVVKWIATQTFQQAVGDRLSGGEKEYEIPHIFTSLTPRNSMSSTPKLFF